MKKITKLIISFICLMFISSCSLFGSGDPYEDTDEINALKEKGQYIDITFEEFEELCKEKDEFILLVKSLYCTQCYYYQDEISTVLNEDEGKLMYALTFEYLPVEGIEFFKKEALEVLGEKFYDNNDFDKDSVYVPLTFQVLDGKIANGFCGFLAAGNLRKMYTFNFYELDYFCNVERKFDELGSFTLHMSTVGGDEENAYLDEVYNEYKNNPSKSQGYYFNLYSLDNEEKEAFINLINERKANELDFATIPNKFEIVVNKGIIENIKTFETDPNK